MKGFQILIGFLLLWSFSRSSAQTFYVTPAGAGSKAGTSWSNAYDNAAFRVALKTAAYGAQFWLAAGTYATENNPDSSFKIPNGVKLYGGFPASGNPGMAQRDWSVYQTIFDGDLNNDDLTGLTGSALNTNPTRQDNSRNIIRIKVADSNTVVDGITVRNGNSAGMQGSAINCDGSRCKIINCSFTRNAGIALYYIISPDVTVKNCYFSNNYTSIYFISTTFHLLSSTFINNMGASTCVLSSCIGTIRQCNFTNNGIVGGSSAGGAILNNASITAIDSCSFTDNYANQGADVYNNSGSICSSFSYCTFNNRRIVNGSVLGGQEGSFYHCHFIDCKATGESIIGVAHPTIRKCEFSGINALTIINSVSFGSSAIIDSCDFSNDTCSEEIIYVWGTSQITFTNFIDNASLVIYNAAANTIIEHCTFKKNNSPYNGVAISNRNNSLGLQIRNCTFERNRSTNINSTSTGFQNGGGAIYINDNIANVTSYLILDCNFISDSSSADGGAIYFKGNKLVLTNCIFENNDAKGSGGAIYGAGIVEINYSVLTRNHAKLAGSLSFRSNNMPPSISNVRNCTFYHNYCDSLSAGIYIAFGTIPGIAKIYNNIFWGNKSAGLVNHLCFSNAKTTLTNNIVQIQTLPMGDSVTNTNMLNNYCRFKDSANFYGPDGIARTADDGLSLQSCSQAINEGDSNFGDPLINVDITNGSRVYGSNVDLGAYEYQHLVNTSVRSVVSIMSHDTAVCNNATINVQASIMNGGPNPTFNWLINGNSFANTLDSHFVFSANLLSDGDTLSALINSIDCLPTDTFSNALIFHLYDAPKASFSISDSTQCLIGNSFHFTDTSVIQSGTFARLWDLGGADTSASSNVIRTYSTAGIFAVKLTTISDHNCKDSIIKTIMVRANPVKPIITKISNSKLQSSPAVLYHWYRNGIALSPNVQVLTISQNGSYKVKTDSNGCSTTSDSLYMGSVGLEESEMIKMQIYPNPANSELYIYAPATGEMHFELYDSKGTEVKDAGFERKSDHHYQLHTSAFPPGLYLLVLRSAIGQSYKKVVIRR